MISLRKRIPALAWMGAELGGTAWLVRLALGWRNAGETHMAWGTMVVFVLCAIVGYVLYRLQERWGGPQTIAGLLCLLALLTGGLLAIAVAGDKMVTLPTDFHANWLWVAPVLYLLIAAIIWAKWCCTPRGH